MDLQVTSREHGPWTVVEVVGDVDVFSAPTLRDEMNAAIEAGNSRLIADLSGVPFLDSTGLGVLVGRLKTVRQSGGELRLVITAERVLRNFAITGLDRVFPISATLDEAVAAAP